MFKEVHAKVPVARGRADRRQGAGREGGGLGGLRGSGELMEVLTGSFWKVAAGRRG